MKLVITIEGLTEILKSVFNPGLLIPGADVPITLAAAPSIDVPPQPEPDTAAADIPTHAAPAGKTGRTIAGPPAPGEPVELDENGIPWDGRVNTSNRGKTAKNIWRRRPGITTEVYAATILELQGAQAAPAASDTTTAPAASGAADAATVTTVDEPTAEPAPITTYAELNAKLMTGCKTIDEVTAACQAAGLQSYALVAGRPDLIPLIVATLGL